MAKLSDLPEDVLVKIWSLLPAKPLIRLKSVQKSWNVLVDDLVKTPSFVANHLYNSTNTTSSSSFILEFCTRNDAKKQRLLTLHHDGDGVEVRVDPNGLDGTELGQMRQWRVGSHCRGIVCLVDHDDGTVTLSNPATGDLKLLPEDRSFGRPKVLGFGYDAISNLYKVVKILWTGRGLAAKVCTFGDGTIITTSRANWRELEVPKQIADFQFLETIKIDVRCGGVLYWLPWTECANYRISRRMVLSFDLHEERFELIEPPRTAGQCNLGLALWRDSLALFCTPFDENLPIEVWVMSAEKSWTKDLTIAQVGGVRRSPEAFWKSGEEILMISQNRRLISYNIAEKKYSHYLGGLEIRKHDSARVVSYVESFVALWNGSDLMS